METVPELGRGKPLPSLSFPAPSLPSLHFLPFPFPLSPLATGLARDSLPQPTHLHTPSLLAYQRLSCLSLSQTGQGC